MRVRFVQGKIGSNLAYCKSYLSVIWETKENPYKAARSELTNSQKKLQWSIYEFILHKEQKL